MKQFSFYVVTDTHYFKTSLGAFGKEYEERMNYEQKCFAETEAINRAAFRFLETRDDADTVLIAGDLTHNGEKGSHEDFSKLLHDFQNNSGKKVYVVTASHDENEHPNAYNDDGRFEVEGTSFSELYGYYKDFGYDRARVFNEEHLSYVADLNDEIRLLVICNDTAEASKTAYSESFLQWIETQAKQAQADGKMMIAMEHYPVIPGQPVFMLIADAYQKESRKVIETLADNGVHLVFTGHMHNQSINTVTTEKGNRFYDVCTGSLIGYPAFIRYVTVFDEKTVGIKSIPIPDFDWDKGGLSGEVYMKKQFERMIRTFLDRMHSDPEKFLGKINIKKTPAAKRISVFLGNKLEKMTVGKLARMFFLKADKSIRENSFVEFAIDLVRNVFEGNQPYVEGTPEGDLLLKLFKRLRPFLKNMKGSQGEKIDFYEMMKHTVGNYGLDDYDTVLHL